MQPTSGVETPTIMLFRRKKPSPDPALEVEFRRQMGRCGKPRELRWIELADLALSPPEKPKRKQKPAMDTTPEERRKAA
jgi:hypothetical protein